MIRCPLQYAISSLIVHAVGAGSGVGGRAASNYTVHIVGKEVQLNSDLIAKTHCSSSTKHQPDIRWLDR